MNEMQNIGTNITPPSAPFKFDEAEMELIKKSVSKYPEGRHQSAVKDLLYLAQKKCGWVPKDAIEEIAKILNTSFIKVLEVATFYTMFNLKPVGKYHLQICGTTPCWLRNSDEIFKIATEKLGIDRGETSEDGMFTISEVECLGACANAPVMQINNENYYEDLSAENFNQLIDDLKAGKMPKTGSQIGRNCSAP